MEECECRYWARTGICQDQYFSDHHPNCPNAKWIKVFRITPGKRLNPCYEKDVDAIRDWMAAADPGEILTIEVLKMQEDVFMHLPEYKGP